MPNLSGLVEMRSHWYEPYLECFLRKDPIGLAGGINPYTFVGNGPMDLRDPSGTSHCVQLQASSSGRGAASSVGAAQDTHGCGGALPIAGITVTVSRSSFAGAYVWSPSSRGYTGMSFAGSAFSGIGFQSGGGACPECGPASPEAQAREAQIRACVTQAGFLVANAALDYTGGRLLYGAVQGAAAIAPEVGWRYALGVYRGDIAEAFMPGLLPAGISTGGAVATNTGPFNAVDLLKIAGGMVLGVGSIIAAVDTYRLCSSLF